MEAELNLNLHLMRNTMKYTVYLRTNLINGKNYVGQTGDLKRREKEWNNLKSIYANKYINEDRDKYSLDNWTAEVLAEVETQEEALDLEKRFITGFNSVWPNGYNLSIGGSGNWQRSDETRQKLSEVNKGKHLSEEIKQKISESLSGEKNPFYGKQHTEEAKQKMSKKRINRSDTSKQVYQYTLDDKLVKIWPSVGECERNGFTSSGISRCCNGELNSHKGYRWSYKPL